MNRRRQGRSFTLCHRRTGHGGGRRQSCGPRAEHAALRLSAAVWGGPGSGRLGRALGGFNKHVPRAGSSRTGTGTGDSRRRRPSRTARRRASTELPSRQSSARAPAARGRRAGCGGGRGGLVPAPFAEAPRVLRATPRVPAPSDVFQTASPRSADRPPPASPPPRSPAPSLSSGPSALHSGLPTAVRFCTAAPGHRDRPGVGQGPAGAPRPWPVSPVPPVFARAHFSQASPTLPRHTHCPR